MGQWPPFERHAVLQRDQQWLAWEGDLWVLPWTTWAQGVSVCQDCTVSSLFLWNHKLNMRLNSFWIFACDSQHSAQRSYGWDTDIITKMKEVSSDHAEYRKSKPYYYLNPGGDTNFNLFAPVPSTAPDPSRRCPRMCGYAKDKVDLTWRAGVNGGAFCGCENPQHVGRLAQVCWTLLGIPRGLVMVLHKCQPWQWTNITR